MAPKIGFYYFRQFADFSFFSHQRFFLLRDKFGAKTFVLIFLAGNFFPNFRLVFPPPSGLATKISPVSTDHDEDSVFQNCNSGSIKSDAETDTRAELKKLTTTEKTKWRRRWLPSLESTFLHLVAHPVDLLHVGEDHLGIDSAVRHHGVHVLSRQEIGNASVASEKNWGNNI